MRVVADTNVLISGLFWEGNEYQLLKMFKRGELTNVISPQIVDELEGVLSRKKFKLTKKQIESIIEQVFSFSRFVHPVTEARVVEKDMSDNIILECALDSKADYIISGDKHLLDLKEYEGIGILNAKVFLNKLK